MKKIILLSLICLSINSCQKKDKLVPQVQETKKDFVFEENLILPVYILSEKTTAIVINLNDTQVPTKYDKLFEKIDSKYSLSSDYYHATPDSITNFTFIDTIGEYKLIRNLAFENEIKKNFDEKYYVYGTKGFSEMKINDVVLGLDECETNIIGLVIKNFDTVKNGKPIFCSNQILHLNYSRNYKQVESLIEKYNTSQLNDYTDSVKTKVFANIDSTYFSFQDDFIWGIKSKKTKCSYPSRGIYIFRKDNTVNPIWFSSLDLFGISCD
jgi:hypothetical protein